MIALSAMTVPCDIRLGRLVARFIATARRERPMDQPTYQRWWALHVRAVLGEILGAADRAFYDAGANELNQEDDLDSDAAEIRTARARLRALEADTAHWRARSEQLNAEISAVEAVLDKRTERLLPVKD
jgi:hypothetical protein